MVDNKEERGSERDEKLDRKVPTLCTDFVCGCVYVCAYTSTNLVYAMTVDTGDTQAAPEKVAAQSRWARLRVQHVDEVGEETNGFDERVYRVPRTHERLAGICRQGTYTYRGGVRSAGTPFVHTFIHSFCAMNRSDW